MHGLAGLYEDLLAELWGHYGDIRECNMLALLHIH